MSFLDIATLAILLANVASGVLWALEVRFDRAHSSLASALVSFLYTIKNAATAILIVYLWMKL